MTYNVVLLLTSSDKAVTYISRCCFF